jgi:exosortase/archaeosortase family protein
MISLTVPGTHYIPFIKKYFDLISFLRNSLLYSTRFALHLMGYESIVDGYYLRLQDGVAIRLVYSCIGYGVMSFWMAFVLANSGSVKRKLFWLVAGIIIIWLINVLRLSLGLLSINDVIEVAFVKDYHTFFNVLAYGAILFLMWKAPISGNKNKKLPG